MRRALAALLRILWAVVRLPVLVVLIALQPIVCGVLWAFSALGLLGAFFYECLPKDLRFPFWTTIAVSVGLAFVAGIYQALIRLVSGSEIE